MPERIDMRIPTASLMARAYQYPGLRLLRNVERAAGVACLVTLLGGVNLWGQGMFATLTSVVSDPTGAMVKGAKVTLVDAVSGSIRETQTNNDGYYTFASVPVGKYDVSVEASGFQNYKATDIVLGGAEKRNLNVGLIVGSTSETVEVSAEAQRGSVSLPTDHANGRNDRPPNLRRRRREPTTRTNPTTIAAKPART